MVWCRLGNLVRLIGGGFRALVTVLLALVVVLLALVGVGARFFRLAKDYFGWRKITSAGIKLFQLVGVGARFFRLAKDYFGWHKVAPYQS